MRYTEGRAWIDTCAGCEAPIIEAHVNGLKTRLSTKAVPYKDALVLSKYTWITVNVWIGPTQLWANPWHWDLGKPLKGHIYIPHIHNVRP